MWLGIGSIVDSGSSCHRRLGLGGREGVSREGRLVWSFLDRLWGCFVEKRWWRRTLSTVRRRWRW